MLRKMLIYSFIRDDKGKVVGKKTLRSIGLHPTFEGFDAKGNTIIEKCIKWGKELESKCEIVEVV